jgi:hypothetical protein
MAALAERRKFIGFTNIGIGTTNWGGSEVDDELYKKTSGGALKDFEQNYNAQKGYENLINLYNEVIA